MDKIIKRPKSLPDTIEKLNLFIQIGKEKLKAYEAKLKAINKTGVELGKEVRDKSLIDTQELAKILLFAEAKMGELLPPPSFQQGKDGKISGQKTLPKGMTWKQSHYAQQLAKHQEIIELIIKEALDQQEVPRRAEAFRKIDALKRKQAQDRVILPKGQYKTIVIDPAWPIQKIYRDRIKQGYVLDYAGKPMSIEAIKEMNLPAADNCHLFLWTIQKFLPISFEVLDAWKFKYILTMVWYKDGGFQPFGLPQYNCEFALYGRKGTPEFIDTKNFFCCFTGKRRGHSRKPKEFYDTIRRVTAAPRIDIFSRGKIDGFETWGDEKNKFNE